MKIRPVKNSDTDQVLKIISDTFEEYGDQVCLEGCDADLVDIEASYAYPDAAFVVVEGEGEVIGCHAVKRVDRDKFTFRRLYIRSDKRGTGAGDLVFNWAMDKAKELGASEIEFWSDTRFVRAHRFFEKYGFRKGPMRDMEDSFHPYSEFQFSRSL